ncbi:MAG: DUF3857 domain-containing protein [Acidobacteriota bacterium]
MIALALTLAAPAAWSATFPPVTEAERGVASVEGFPNAPAVVLSKRAELTLRDPSAGESSTLEIHTRTKILTEAGLSRGQVAVSHGPGLRLEGVEGRTLLADGREVPLESDSVFVEQTSRARRSFRTKAVLPAVAVGAILDVRLRLRFDSVFFPEPWSFEEPIPVLHSELRFTAPPGMGVRVEPTRGEAPWTSEPIRTGGRQGARLVMTDLSPPAEEPFGLAGQDLRPQAVVIPVSYVDADGFGVPLLDAWDTVLGTFERRHYGPVRAGNRGLDPLARRLAKAEDPAAAILGYVRDGVATAKTGVLPAPGETLAGILAAGSGSYAAKAILLQELLSRAGIDGTLVWAIDWRDGEPDLGVVNPGWFEKVLVRIDRQGIDGYLDPGDPRLPPFRLAPMQEGTSALLLERSGPRPVTLPTTPAVGSLRRATMELRLGEDGAFGGVGRLALRGHHAWYHLLTHGDGDARSGSWRAWLSDALPEFDVSAVEVEESVRFQRVDVSFRLDQKRSQVLGDEAALRPSLPLGPVRQRYDAPTEARRTPVRISFPDQDEVEMTLSWPPGWELDAAPADLDVRTDVGHGVGSLELGEGGDRLVYRRRFTIHRRTVQPGEPYAALRDLYAEMERHDAQEIVLIHE